ncbi:MAG: glycosyltransferase family A protein [Syntrophobacteraceae bacterium]|nr:glycosyltransferase family A protein [Syntrophobacteraceae bacterium]
MNTEPIHNDPNDPLISVFVYNYDPRYLGQCLESIFNQSVLRNCEVILIDDASSESFRDIALEYVSRYPRRITFQRNRKVLGPKANLRRSLWLARGRNFLTFAKLFELF